MRLLQSGEAIGSKEEEPTTVSIPRFGLQTSSSPSATLRGLEGKMASLKLMDDSPSPRKGNFLRLTPAVEAA